MFQYVDKEIASRSFSIEQLYSEQISKLGPTFHPAVKGFAFVSMYAIQEYTIKEVLSAALGLVMSHKILWKSVRRTMVPWLLARKLQSIRERSSKKSIWADQAKIFEIAGSDVVLSPGASFPSNGEQFRKSQVEVIWDLLGIPHPVVTPPLDLRLFDEIVEWRNQIAHGQETAENIGKRYSTVDIESRIHNLRDICLHISATIQLHCSSPVNLTEPP